ncbi:MAG: T9SS type A sorting domain-containing protein, partial [Bacteroidales bacterium]|nr:T9SS type A sorting domain-containing protein [Bacteroidales bacterium]
KDNYQNSEMCNADYIIETGSGLAEITNSQKISVYPMPAKNIINIDLKSMSENDITVHLFNAVGELVYTNIFSPSQIIRIDISAFAPGCYYLNLNNGSSMTAKVIIY